MSALTLGDAGANNTDPSYEGVPSSVSMDWFRKKFSEFQVAMNAADEAYQAGSVAFNLTGDEGVANLLAEYDSNAAQIKTIAETLNVGADLANAAGGRMPVLSIPGTLGALPAFVLPAAVIAAVMAVAGWYAWANGYASGMHSAIRIAKQSGAGPEVVAALEQEETRAAAAVAKLDLSPLKTAGTWAKLLLVCGLGFLAFRSFNQVMDR